MIPQIYGTKKCANTRKALRFFKERGTEVQFVDISAKAPSPGELKDMISRVGAEALIDTTSRRYRDRGLAYMDFDPQEELAQTPDLMRTPVIRSRSTICVGDNPDCWTALISSL